MTLERQAFRQADWECDIVEAKRRIIASSIRCCGREHIAHASLIEIPLRSNTGGLRSQSGAWGIAPLCAMHTRSMSFPSANTP